MKKIIYILWVVIAICACGTTKKQPVEEQPVVAILFNADSAYTFCAAQCDFGPRVMNSEAHEKCGTWIQQKFQQYGYLVEIQNANLKGYNGTILKSWNIIAKQPTTNSQQPTANNQQPTATSQQPRFSSAPTGIVAPGQTTTPTQPIGANL